MKKYLGSGFIFSHLKYLKTINIFIFLKNQEILNELSF